jgi:hypothetical protein
MFMQRIFFSMLSLKSLLLILISSVMFFMTSHGQNTQGTADKSTRPPDSSEIKVASEVILSFITQMMKDSSVDEAMNLFSLPMMLDSDMITKTSVLRQLLGVFYFDLHKTVPYRIKIDSVYYVAYRRGNIYDIVPFNLYFTNLTLGYYKDDQHGTKQILFALQVSDKTRIVGMKTKD